MVIINPLKRSQFIYIIRNALNLRMMVGWFYDASTLVGLFYTKVSLTTMVSYFIYNTKTYHFNLISKSTDITLILNNTED